MGSNEMSKMLELFDNLRADKYPLEEYNNIYDGCTTARDAVRKIPYLPLPSCRNKEHGHQQSRGVARRKSYTEI